MIVDDISRSARNLKELFVDQKKKYKANSIEYKMLDKQFEQISQKLKILNNVIKSSTRQYILSNKLDLSTQKIIQLLITRYKLTP
jgi:hypothetical protein